jgi:hypothetical protein
MNKEDALKAIDCAFDDGVKHLYDVFLQGLVTGTDAATLAERFHKGLAFHNEAHGKTKAIVEDYFRTHKGD